MKTIVILNWIDSVGSRQEKEVIEIRDMILIKMIKEIKLPIFPKKGYSFELKDFYGIYGFTEEEIQHLLDFDYNNFKVHSITIHPDYTEVQLVPD